MSDMKRKFSLRWVAIIAVLLVAAIYYVRYLKLHPSTDDAYVQAHSIQIAAQVSGPIDEVLVEDNQPVKKGDLLFRIDQRPFKIALDKAAAAVILTSHGLKSDDAGIKAAKAIVEQREVQLALAKKTAKRVTSLVKQERLSAQEGDKAESEVKAVQASLAAAKEQLQQVLAKRGQTGTDNAQLRVAKATFAEAGLNLAYTEVFAPADGIVTKMKLRKGSIVNAHQPLFALVEDNNWWVEANFKETQLKRIREGQPADIEIDMYPGETFKGHVASLSAASGAAFSLLPPENASGNWVKVTQRFPIIIEFNALPEHLRLAVGSSSKVTVDTSQFKDD